MTPRPPSPKLVKILEGKAVFDQTHGWMLPGNQYRMSPGRLAALLMGELNRHPEGFSTLLKLLPEGYFDEPLDAYTRIEYASRALEELPYLVPYSEEIAGLIKQAAEKFCDDTETLPTRCYIGTEEWMALREYHAKNNLELHPSPEKDAYPVFEGMQLYMVNQPRHLFVA